MVQFLEFAAEHKVQHLFLGWSGRAFHGVIQRFSRSRGVFSACREAYYKPSALLCDKGLQAGFQTSSSGRAARALQRQIDLGMDLPRRGGEEAVARLLAIVDEFAAVETGKTPTRLFENEIGRGDIPVIGIFRGKTGVERPRCDIGDAHRQRRHAGLKREFQPRLTQLGGEQARRANFEVGVKGDQPRDFNRIAVETRPAFLHRDIGLVEGGRMNDADQGSAIAHQRNGDRPGWLAAGEGARAVDRIDDQQEPLVEARCGVLRFLGQPAGFRQEVGKTLLQESIDKVIRLGDGRSASLVRDGRAGVLAMAKKCEREFARTPCRVLNGCDQYVGVCRVRARFFLRERKPALGLSRPIAGHKPLTLTHLGTVREIRSPRSV